MCEEKYILLRAFDVHLDIMNIRTGEKLTIFPEDAKLYNIININEREKIADQLRRDNPYFVIIVGYVTLSLQQSLDEPNRIYILDNKIGEISEEYITAQPDKYYLVSINGKKEKWLKVYDLFIMQKRGCEIINGILKSENDIVLSCSILPYPDMSYSLEEIQPYLHVEVTERSKNYISRIKLDFKFIPPHLKKIELEKIRGIDSFQLLEIKNKTKRSIEELVIHGDYKIVMADYISWNCDIEKITFTGNIGELHNMNKSCSLQHVDVLENCFSGYAEGKISIKNNPSIISNSFNAQPFHNMSIDSEFIERLIRHAKVIKNSFLRQDIEEIRLGKNCEEYTLTTYRNCPKKVIVTSNNTRVYGNISSKGFKFYYDGDENAIPVEVVVPKNYKHAINTTNMTVRYAGKADPAWLLNQQKKLMRAKLIGDSEMVNKIYPSTINLDRHNFTEAIKYLQKNLSSKNYYKLIDKALNHIVEPTPVSEVERSERNRDCNVFCYDQVSVVFDFKHIGRQIGYLRKITKDVYFAVSKITGVGFFIFTSKKHFFNKKNHKLINKSGNSILSRECYAVVLPTLDITFITETPQELKNLKVKSVEVLKVDGNTDIITCFNWLGDVVATYKVDTSDLILKNSLIVSSNLHEKNKNFVFNLEKLKP